MGNTPSPHIRTPSLPKPPNFGALFREIEDLARNTEGGFKSVTGKIGSDIRSASDKAGRGIQSLGATIQNTLNKDAREVRREFQKAKETSKKEFGEIRQVTTDIGDNIQSKLNKLSTESVKNVKRITAESVKLRKDIQSELNFISKESNKRASELGSKVREVSDIVRKESEQIGKGFEKGFHVVTDELNRDFNVVKEGFDDFGADVEQLGTTVNKSFVDFGNEVNEGFDKTIGILERVVKFLEDIFKVVIRLLRAGFKVSVVVGFLAPIVLAIVAVSGILANLSASDVLSEQSILLASRGVILGTVLLEIWIYFGKTIAWKNAIPGGSYEKPILKVFDMLS